MLRTWGCEEWGPWELGGCGQKQDVNYNMRVTGAFNDPLDRQIMERIQIQNFKGPVLMNRRSEMGGVRVERMQYRRWGGEWAGWRRLPPPTLQVTQETLSSWAGAAIFTPIEAKMWHLAICSPVSVPYQGGGTPLCSDLDQGAGEEAKARQVEPGGMEELWREGQVLRNQVIVYPRQPRENFLVPHFVHFHFPPCSLVQIVHFHFSPCSLLYLCFSCLDHSAWKGFVWIESTRRNKIQM